VTKTLFSAITILGLAGSLSAQNVVEQWIVPGGSGSTTNNTWLNASHTGRGIDFIAAGVPQNTLGESVIAVTNGIAGNSSVQIMAADDGQHLSSFVMTPTASPTIDHYRLATSEDGYIFVNGYDGTVQQYTMAGGAPVVAVAASVYGTVIPAITGNGRALEVTGNVSAGTAKIIVGRGQTLAFFGNTPEATSTFSYLGQVSLAAEFTTNDIASIASYDGSLVYVSPTNGTNVQRVTVTYTPAFDAVKNGAVSQYAVFIKQGLAINATGTRMAIGEAGGPQDGFAIANITMEGMNLANIAPAPGLDGDLDSVYDAGDLNLDASNAVVDVAMDPLTDEVYGYSSQITGLEAASGAVMKLRVAEADVSDWNLY